MLITLLLLQLKKFAKFNLTLNSFYLVKDNNLTSYQLCNLSYLFCEVPNYTFDIFVCSYLNHVVKVYICLEIKVMILNFLFKTWILTYSVHSFLRLYFFSINGLGSD